MSQFNIYVYADASGRLTHVDENDVQFTGTWSSTGSYGVSKVASYGNTNYVTVSVPIIGQTPPGNAAWSPFALIFAANPGTQTNDTAASAFAIAVAGTNAAASAHTVAAAAYALAQHGTNSHKTLAFASTISIDMNGSAYQSVVISGNTTVTVQNQAAPGNSSIQVVNARFISDGAGSHFVNFDTFSWYGTQPPFPYSIPNAKAAILNLTSYGNTIADVAAFITNQV